MNHPALAVLNDNASKSRSKTSFGHKALGFPDTPSRLNRPTLRVSRISKKNAAQVLDSDQGAFLAFGDPFINHLFVESPDPADPNRWDFAFFGQLAYR
jgi:hypothetical protein